MERKTRHIKYRGVRPDEYRDDLADDGAGAREVFAGAAERVGRGVIDAGIADTIPPYPTENLVEGDTPSKMIGDG